MVSTGAGRATDHLVRSIWLGKVCRHEWIQTSYGHHNRVHGFLGCEIENCCCRRAETSLEADSVAQIRALRYVVFDPAFDRFGELLALLGDEGISCLTFSKVKFAAYRSAKATA